MTFEKWFLDSHSALKPPSVQAVLELAKDGATIPFIARYRKEMTGNLDEVQIQLILDQKEEWDQIIKRQAFILKEIEHQQKLTPELKEKISQTFQSEILEDLYLPYKIKRKTKAAQAREAGLEPLADWIWNTGNGTEKPEPGQTLELWAFTFRDEKKGVADAEAAIAGAQDILIERLSEVQELRQMVRSRYFAKGHLKTLPGKSAKPNSKFEPYFQYQESIPSLLEPQNSHRYLAIKRGWTEEELSLKIEGPSSEPEFETEMIQAFESHALQVPDAPGASVLRKAALLAFKAYVFPSIETEIHKALRDVADHAAIDVFAENLKRILLASPYGSKAVLGVDPGIKTGCKVAVVDDSGKYIASTVMHLESEQGRQKAALLLPEVIKTGGIRAVAVGNGTGGREAEKFIRDALKSHSLAIPVVMVNEAGASVYSASEAAREEFPDLDLTVRGAISIARRLQDPLAELVKIDPKSVGVGQYQHDVSSNALKRSLGFVVESCVNSVGVNLNTASYRLLSYVAGVGPSLAKAIVEYRGQKGLFSSRSELLQVGRFTKKAFEQAAGFLRVPGSEHPLDNTGIHPELYSKLEEYVKKVGKDLKDLIGPGSIWIKKEKALEEELGKFTFDDLVQELAKPGRDPREEFTHVQFRDDTHEIKDLKPGMVCPGIVTNVTNFGAFVDIGVHQDGLVHLSQLSDRFIKDPKEVVSPGQHVQVRVLDVNIEKNQISLSMKSLKEKVFRERERENEKERAPEKPRVREKVEIIPVRASAPRKPSPIRQKEAFNNAFAGLAQMRGALKPKK